MKVLPLAGISASLAIQGVVAYGLRAESSNTTIVDLGYAVHQGSLNVCFCSVHRQPASRIQCFPRP